MFAGIVEFTSNQSNGTNLLNQLNAETGLASIPFEDKGYFQGDFADGKITLVQQRYYNTRESHNEKGIIEHTPSETKIIAWARIDNRHELRKQLETSFNELLTTDSGLILAAYLKWGKKCVDHLVGDFSFAIIDLKQNDIFMVRDHTGARPLYYYWDGDCFAFSSSIAILNQLDIKLDISTEWMAFYLSGYLKNWEDSAYTDIKKCPPTHSLSFNSKSIHLQQYFTFSATPDLQLGSDEEYMEAYREILFKAVTCRVNSQYPIAAESSGGLDSSTIAAIAAIKIPHAGRYLHCLGFDEDILTGQYILQMARRFPMRKLTFFSHTAERNPAIFQEFLESFGTPREHPNSTANEPIYTAARQMGLRTLLSGFGGDEFVTTEAPVALVEFWTQKKLSLFFSRQRGNLITKPMHTARWLYNFYRYNNQSISSRGIQASGRVAWSIYPVKENIHSQYPVEEIITNRNRYDAGFTTQNDFAVNNRWSPIISARMETCSVMAARYGLDYRWPLMDIRLLKLFLSIPSEQKLGPNQVGRYLHRRAVDGLLPNDITWKEKSMRGLNKWQKLINIAKRHQNEQKMNQLSQQNLNSNQQKSNTDTPPQAQIHPRLLAMLEPKKLAHLMKINKNPGKHHDSEQIYAKQIMINLTHLNSWLNQNDPDNNSDNSNQ